MSHRVQPLPRNRSLVSLKPMAMVVHRDHPLTPVVKRQVVPVGLTVAEVLQRLGYRQDQWHLIRVSLNGIPLLPEYWRLIRQKESTILAVLPVPGDDAQDLLRTHLVVALNIAVAVATMGLSVPAQIAATAIGGAVISYGVNALIPPSVGKLSSLGRAGERESNTLSITGSQNKADPYGPVPVVYGKHRLYPPYAAQPYTEIVGDDEYLVLLFCCGVGPMELYDFRIGNTPIADFDDVQIEVYRAIGDGAAITLYQGTADVNSESILITQAGGSVTRTLPEADRAVINLVFPALVEFAASGGRLERLVNAKVEYRRAGTEDGWTIIPQRTATLARSNPSNAIDELVNDPNQRVRYYQTVNPVSGAIDIAFNYPIFQPSPLGQAQIQSVELAISTRPVGWATYWTQHVVTLPTNTAVSYQLAMQQPDVPVEIKLEVLSYKTFDKPLAETPDVVPVPTVTYTPTTRYEAEFIGKKDSTVRFAMEVTFPERGSYEYRVTRLTEDNTDTAVRDEMYLAGATSYLNEFPIKRSDLALVALRLRANEQLNGVVDTFNCIGHRYLTTRENGVYAKRLSRSPAWAFYDMLTNPQIRSNPLDAALVDVDAIEAWHDYCQQPAPASSLPGAVSNVGEPLRQFDAVIDFRSSVREMMQDIARVGNASPHIGYDMRRKVIIDQEQVAPVLYFSPHDSSDFSFSKTFVDVPHGLKVRFLDAANNYQEGELYVYADGYNHANATKIETVELFGITERGQAWRTGRKVLAEMVLRPVTYSLKVGLKHLLCERGDMVAVTHDVIGVGLGSGRLQDPVYDEFGGLVGLHLIEPVLLAENTNYQVRWQGSNGLSYLREINVAASGVGEQYAITFTAPLVAGSFAAPRYGDMFVYGESEKVTSNFIVKEIRIVDHNTAQLKLVDAAPAVHRAATEPLPPVLNISSSNPALQAPSPPTGIAFTEILRWENGIPKIAITASWQAPGGTPVKEYALQLQVNGEAPQSIGSVTGSSMELGDFATGDIVRLSITAYGFGVGNGVPLQSPSVVQSYTVRQAVKFEPPADVTQFRITIQDDKATLSWQPSPSFDTAHYALRFAATTTNAEWAKAQPLVELLPRDQNTLVVAARKGTYLLKAVDIEGNESVNAVRVVNTIDEQVTRNVVVTLDEAAGGFAGVKDTVSVDSGVLRLAGSSLMDDWPNLDIIADWDTGGAGIADQGVYYFDGNIDLGGVYTVRVIPTMVSSSFTVGDTMDSWADLDSRSNWDGDNPDLWKVALAVRITNNDPAGTPGWGDWQDIDYQGLLGVDLTGRAFEFKLTLFSLGQMTSPAVESLNVVIDVPDRVASGQDLAIPTGGTRISFSPAFMAAPAIAPVLQDLQTGEQAVISNRDATGFDISIVGASSNRTFDYVARGYGYQQ